MDFRTRLREEIDFSGLLDKEVAARANISKRTIDSYVGSQNCMPSADVAVRLAKVLNTTVEYLVTGSNPELPQTHDIKLQEIFLECLLYFVYTNMKHPQFQSFYELPILIFQKTYF